MLIRHLPLILAPAIVLALAPLASAAQELGPGIRTEMTPVDREAHNGVFDHKRKSGPGAGLKPSVTLGEVKPVERPAVEYKAEDVAAGYVTQAHPYSTDPPPPKTALKTAPRPESAGQGPRSENKARRPGADKHQVRPAQASPAQRVDLDRIDGAPKDDPRSVEERKDPGG